MTYCVVEIIDDQHIRCNDGTSWQLLTDNELFRRLANNKQLSILLTDPVYTATKTFTRQVKDKKILDQVIVAEIGDYLLYDAAQYHFARAAAGENMWVAWMEKSRLQALQQRFAAIRQHIKGLIPMPLLLGQLLLKPGQTGLFRGQDFVYVLLSDEALSLPAVQAQTWLDGYPQSFDQQLVIPSTLAVAQLNSNIIKQLPNLWTTKANTDTTLPLKTWAAGIVMLMMIWCVNSYWDYQRAKQRNQAIQSAQMQLLQQVYPQAKSPDPYGRLRAEYEHSGVDSRAILTKLSAATATKTQHFSTLSVDMSAHEIVIEGELSADSITGLQQQGFTVTQQDQQTQLRWVGKP